MIIVKRTVFLANEGAPAEARLLNNLCRRLLSYNYFYVFAFDSDDINAAFEAYCVVRTSLKRNRQGSHPNGNFVGYCLSTILI